MGEYEGSGGDEVMPDSPEAQVNVEHYNPVNIEHYCHVQLGKGYGQGVCDTGCFNTETNMPLSFSEGSDNFAMFCKTKPSACQFPFIWDGKNYTSCTNEGSEFYWCAVSVHQDRTIRGKRWGKCDMNTCTEDTIVEEEPDDDNRIMIIIIVLIVVILLLLIIITALICYCVRRNKRKSLDIKCSESSLDDDCLKRENEKHPLYDELSIPFIDASCPPTPKLEGSYVFTRTGSLRRASKSSSTDESSDYCRAGNWCATDRRN